MKVALFGEFNSRMQAALFDSAAQKIGKPLTVLVGDSPSDRRIQRYCKENSIDVVVFKPIHILDIKSDFHPRFFYIRNMQILHNADFVWVSKGDTVANDIEAVLRYVHSNKLPLMEY